MEHDALIELKNKVIQVAPNRVNLVAISEFLHDLSGKFFFEYSKT